MSWFSKKYSEQHDHVSVSHSNREESLTEAQIMGSYVIDEGIASKNVKDNVSNKNDASALDVDDTGTVVTNENESVLSTTTTRSGRNITIHE